MNTFFRRGKDSLLKESLQSQLVSCVKDIQLDHAHSGRFQSSTETAEALCSVLEAIFIHGIKETFADQMAIAIGDPDTRPEPNFWPALLVFSHREIIDQISKLNFISTDIGRCRAWLRMALNDGLLTSYLQSMLSQNRALNSFYNRSAYLRDKELLDMFVTLISGIEAYSFNLACNSSLLNMWTNQPLLMSGVWSPAMKTSSGITSGTDIARSIADEDSRAIQEDSRSSIVSIASYYGSSLESSTFDEDEALQIILGTDVGQKNVLDPTDIGQDFRHKQSHGNSSDNIAASTDTCEPAEVLSSISIQESVPIKELVKENDTLVETHDQAETSIDAEKEPEELQSTVEVEEKQKQKKKLQSYHSLVENYNKTSPRVLSEKPDLQTLLQKFPKPSEPSPTISSTDSDPDMKEKLDFEIVPDNAGPSDIPEFGTMIQLVDRIATEPGLDSQNYMCKSCPDHIGLNFGDAKVCGYTGAYYCSDCFGPDSINAYWVIPARVIYNWDFRRYLVNQKAAHFLSQIQLYPLFDLSAINPKIYSAIEEMTRLKELRVRLNFLCAYLLTCRDNAIESLQRQLWPRDYLYEKLHFYSLADLIQVSTGALEVVLQKAVDQSRAHVLSCSLCSQKGFICEICNNPKVIFPFDLKTTYRCQDCSAVYHAECLQAGQLCRKCCRIQQRESQLLSEAS